MEHRAVTKLSDAQIAERLRGFPGWRRESGTLSRLFVFADFVAAMRFVNAVADAAEAANHHPDIRVQYNKVTLQLVTHDAGGITASDFALAATVSDLC